jgi:hypothetical protein
MTDLSTANPAIPTEADVDAAVGAFTDQFVGHGSNVALAPKGLTNWDLQSWNVGQLTAGMANKPNLTQVQQLARQMYPGFDRFSAQQQQFALQIANVSWYAQNNTPVSSADALTPGTAAVPNLALDAQARKMYGADAWMLNIPELRAVLENAAAKQWDQATLEAQVRSTQWWQTTSQAQQQFMALQATSPEELDFANPGSQASQRLAHVQQVAAAAGVSLDPQTLQGIALKSMEFSWTDDLLKQALAAQVQYNPAGGTDNVGSVIQQLQGVANDYLLPNDPANYTNWAKGIVGGTQTVDQYRAQAQSDAASKYGWAAPQLQQGMTMQQITSSLRSQAAQLMEVDPSQIDFVNNPTYSKILDYVPQGDTVHRAMTGSEAATYLRGTSAWGYTQQARDLAGTWANNLLKTFGVVAQ